MWLLDSNILIGCLAGNTSISKWIDDRLDSDYLLISIISRIETLGSDRLNNNDLYETEKFLSLLQEVMLSSEVASIATKLRRNTKLELPDAIIAASAISRRATLVTNDQVLAKKVKEFVEVLSLK